ncbi:transposase [Streptomyces goshikiensis]
MAGQSAAPHEDLHIGDQGAGGGVPRQRAHVGGASRRAGGNSFKASRRARVVSDRTWLTAFLMPAYAPDLNPVEGVWAHVKRSLANLAVIALDRLETLVRNRLKRLQYRPGTLDGFIAGTGLTLDTPTSP